MSANVVKRTTCFCEGNPRQFRVTFVVILNLFQDLIIRKGLLNIVKADSLGVALRMTKNDSVILSVAKYLSVESCPSLQILFLIDLI